MESKEKQQGPLRQLRKRVGITGIITALLVVLAPLFWIGKHFGWFTLDILALIPFGFIVAVRFLRYLLRTVLWSLRNRLLVVYVLIGVLPIFLIVVLVGVSAWALTSELAIYIATSSLDRQLAMIADTADVLHNLPAGQRQAAIPKMWQLMRSGAPDVVILVKDSTGMHRYPPAAAEIPFAPGWKTARGLVALNDDFYGWAHLVDEDEEITVIRPLTPEFVSNLVPSLGVIHLYETEGQRARDKHEKTGGTVTVNIHDNQNYTVQPGKKQVAGKIPPPVNRLDIAVPWYSTYQHSDLDQPDVPHPAVLEVDTRPSAVLATIFTGTDSLRGVLVWLIAGIAILFLFMEVVAAGVGLALATRVTGTVNSLYEGTRRIIYGDFRHRIPVRSRDQVGELTQSFNQMTDNLERLLVVEKEKERLETELEIAREVQNQLYPKQMPPVKGLRLTVECDPARMVSGDYYDYQVIPPGRLAFAIGDVAGKGISAALLMATLQAALRAQVNQYAESGTKGEALDAAELVGKLNRQIYANTAPEKYATFFFALYDSASRVLTYTNAGHLPPLLIRNGVAIPLEVNGTVVGAFPFSKYEESKLQLQLDDLLVCYTDGITEPENAYGEMFGEERLIEMVIKNAHLDSLVIIRTVMEAVRNWTGTPELQDDMTLLVARHGEALA
jgi:sigma-B regulation protein RsbU (phosphoserine phosphatase)